MSTITLATPAERRPPRPRPAEPIVARSDDELMAFLLVTNWTLRTGRRLRHAPPDDLTEAELLEFWGDPACEPAADPDRNPLARPSAHPETRS